jgi:peptidyl-prolyl cis-trans isomerase SurA
MKYSDDAGKKSGGFLINNSNGPNSGTTWWEMDELEPQVSFVINKLEVGQISTPVPAQTEEGKDAYRLIKLNARVEPHRANLTDDYSLITTSALSYKKEQKIMEWVNNNVENAYIMIIDDYKNCDFDYNWFPGQE